MIALVGFSRFPIFISPDGSVFGAFVSDNDFSSYVNRLTNQYSKFIALYSIPNFRIRRYYLLKKVAVNPINFKTFDIPTHIFVFPDTEPEDINAYSVALGYLIYVGRSGVFLPIIYLRKLLLDEVKFLERIVGSKINSLSGIIRNVKIFRNFLSSFNVELKKYVRVADGLVIKIFDNDLGRDYYVYLNKNGLVNDTNICVSWVGDLSIFELIALVKEERDIFTYDPSNYDWIVNL